MQRSHIKYVPKCEQLSKILLVIDLNNKIDKFNLKTASYSLKKTKVEGRTNVSECTCCHAAARADIPAVRVNMLKDSQ